MKLEDLKKIRAIIDKEIEKMEKNKEAQRRFVAKKGKGNKGKAKTLAERVKELENKLS